MSAAVLDARPHPLPADGRHWPQGNCYVDLWIELLHARGHDPMALFAYAVTQDFEGDQFTFTKPPAEDIELLYGLAVQELQVYDTLESHLVEQAAQGRVVLVEVDGWHLPDTAGLTYRAEHGKTTIGVQHVDPAARALRYFHNDGFHALDGEDYDALMAPTVLPPYAEFVSRRGSALDGAALRAASLDRLRLHLRRSPRRSPVRAFRDRFPAQLDRLLERPQAFFHQYAFNTVRQLGSNFELLGRTLAWLAEPGLEAVPAACDRLASDAKVLQFRLARLAARRRRDPCTDSFDALEAAYDEVVAALRAHFG
jgi:hypothetical protein